MKRLLVSLVFVLGLCTAPAPLAAAGPPTNLSKPVISGTAAVGQTLTVSTGSWAGSPTSFSYEFLECAAICSPGGSYSVLAAQASNSYKLTSADAGHQVYAAVEATNTHGSAVAVADSTSIVSGTGTAGATSTQPRNPEPDAVITISAKGGRTLALNGGFSVVHRPATKLIFFRWIFGDGRSGSGRRVLHTYPRAGIYTVSLTVTDNLGGSASSSRITNVG